MRVRVSPPAQTFIIKLNWRCTVGKRLHGTGSIRLMGRTVKNGGRMKEHFSKPVSKKRRFSTPAILAVVHDVKKLREDEEIGKEILAMERFMVDVMAERMGRDASGKKDDICRTSLREQFPELVRFKFDPSADDLSQKVVQRFGKKMQVRMLYSLEVSKLSFKTVMGM